ncbi:MAG: hypothetical protein MUE52_10970 [Tabrizicola sp.]|jgi:hypothetical protein|nr:hypothetical protein [Tabrizicola sp.]
MRRVGVSARRQSRYLAIVLFLAVWVPLTVAWLVWDGFATFFSRPSDLERLILLAPPVFGLLCLWDLLVERRDARRETSAKPKE